jgi:hypothetical protein
MWSTATLPKSLSRNNFHPLVGGLRSILPPSVADARSLGGLDLTDLYLEVSLEPLKVNFSGAYSNCRL